jgi:hypothetical protein
MTLQSPQIVDVKRRFGGEIRGYVVSRNSQLVVIREFNGFSPGGFVVIPASTIDALEINEPWSRMLASEGHATLSSIRPWFPVDEMSATLVCIRDQRVNVQVECENVPNADESGFHIGRIVRLDDSSLDFVFFDSMGRWFASPYSIPYTSITQIVVDDPYVINFSKYVGECPIGIKDGG